MPVMVADPSDHTFADARKGIDQAREDAAALASLLEQAARALRSLCFASDLHPVQWAALRFLAAAEPSRRTLKALALHQGTTPAPVSRTIAVLIRKGYLRATVDLRDRRSRRLDVTEAGENQLERDPLLQLQSVLQASPPEEQAALRRVLERAIPALGGAPEERGAGGTAVTSAVEPPRAAQSPRPR